MQERNKIISAAIAVALAASATASCGGGRTDREKEKMEIEARNAQLGQATPISLEEMKATAEALRVPSAVPTITVTPSLPEGWINKP